MPVTDELSGDATLQRAERAQLLTGLAARITSVLPTAGDHVSAVPGLILFRRDGFCEPVSSLIDASLSLVIQGRKRVAIGAETYEYGAGQFALTSVDLPSLSQILDTANDYPFLSLSLRLDSSIVRELSEEIDHQGLMVGSVSAGLAIASAATELLEAMARLTKLLDAPQDIPVLAALLQREIVYRLLLGPTGDQLREVAVHGTQSHRIVAVVAWMRANYAHAIRVEELAEMAAMAVSTFHLHFKSVTHMSPLQYQKQIRLHEARRLLLNESSDASSAAFRVGYESVTQFSREYRRLFGNPPMRDVALKRAPRRQAGT